jgi:hypothetical protein
MLPLGQSLFIVPHPVSEKLVVTVVYYPPEQQYGTIGLYYSKVNQPYSEYELEQRTAFKSNNI